MKRSIASVALVLAACAGSTPRGEPERVTLIVNGRIYLGAPGWKAVEALLVRDGRVVAAGSRAQVEASASARAVERIDLGGAVAVPGLQDAHGHVEGLGAALETVDLRGAASYSEVIERVARAARTLPAETWIEGRGWDQNLWPEPVFPHHAALSAAIPDHYVVLSRIDGHAVLVNARVLQLAGREGVAANEEVVPGGRMLLDPERKPTGVFVDAAESLVTSLIPRPDDATRERRILLAQEHLLSLGLTAVHDMGVGARTLAVMQKLRDEGRLELRLIEYWSDSGVVGDDVRRAANVEADARGLLQVIGVKLYADGALGSRGAALLAPYSDDPGNAGLVQATPQELAERIAAYAALGLQPAVHAIGDRANRIVLDVYEQQMRRDPGFAALRPRLEHAQVVAPEDWPRFEALGVVPSMQPTHATSDMRWADERLGQERLAGAYAWRRLAPDLSKLAFGSDFPVEDPNPLLGLYAAVTRQDASGWPEGGFTPDQRIDAASALAAFTSGAARAVRQERTRGALRPGYCADLTVLDVDPLRSDLLRARVTMTVINGKVVYRAP